MGTGIPDFRAPDRLHARSRGPCAMGVFFGVIAVSVYQIGIARSFRNLLIFGGLGMVLGFGFLSLPPKIFPALWWLYFSQVWWRFVRGFCPVFQAACAALAGSLYRRDCCG